MSTYCIGDTETADITGGIVDIALMFVDEDLNELGRIESLVDPERPISPSAGGVHGIRDEDVANAPTLAEFDEVYSSPLKVPDLVLMGHNISFDIRMMAPILPEPMRNLCSLKVAKLAWPDAPDHKLQTLRYMFRLPGGEAHRAMGDVVTCRSLLLHAAQTLGTNLPGLMEFVRKPLPKTTKINFGKHRGTMIKDLPSDYVSWLLNKSDSLDEDLRQALLAM